ncbi:hypothetical protein ACOTJI_32335, partial [Achromobacter xylosoxidans]
KIAQSPSSRCGITNRWSGTFATQAAPTPQKPLNSGVSTTETLLYFAHVYSNGIQFLKRCAALGLPFLWASPGGVTLVCGLFGLWPLCSKREQLFFS